MNPLDLLMLLIGLVIVVWYVAWFTTYKGERVISSFDQFQFKVFVFFSATLIVAFALIAVYFVLKLEIRL